MLLNNIVKTGSANVHKGVKTWLVDRQPFLIEMVNIRHAQSSGQDLGVPRTGL